MKELVAALIGIILGWVTTYTAVNASWANDCKQIHAHTYERIAYDCKVRQ